MTISKALSAAGTERSNLICSSGESLSHTEQAAAVENRGFRADVRRLTPSCHKQLKSLNSVSVGLLRGQPEFGLAFSFLHRERRQRDTQEPNAFRDREERFEERIA